MTEPVRDVEIEDVLSSIRRLVSEDKRPISHVRDAESPTTGRLVLTPALRVADEAVAQYPATAADEIPQQDNNVGEVGEDARTAGSEVPSEGRKTQVLQDQVERAEAAVESGQAISSVCDPLESESVAQDIPLQDLQTEGAALAVQEDATVQDIDIPRFEHRIAALEAVVAGRDDQWEPDGNVGDDYAGSPVDTFFWEDAQDEPGPSGPMTYTDDAIDAESMENSRSALEAEEPDESALFASAVPPDRAVSGPEMTNADMLGTDEAILDEDSLREMVAEIVRQELQGALGERITRNVRKLVRREIHRALTSQELE